MSAEPIDLRTHTGLWRMEKKLYKLYDFTLPLPVSVRQLGTVAGVGIPWLFLMKILHVPFHPPFGEIIWFAPPGLAAWWANKPVAEGKRLGELLFSQFGYVTQSRAFARMRPFRLDRTRLVRSAIWYPAGAVAIGGHIPESERTTHPVTDPEATTNIIEDALRRPA